MTNSQRNEALNSAAVLLGKQIPKFGSMVAVKVMTFVLPVELPNITWGMDILTGPLKHLILTLESSAQNSMKKWIKNLSKLKLGNLEWESNAEYHKFIQTIAHKLLEKRFERERHMKPELA